MSVAIYPMEIVPVNGPIIFLAGPIQGAPLWQEEAIEWFCEHAPGLTIASPRWEHRPGEFVCQAQVDWETHYLRLAGKTGAILFWLAKEVVATPGRAYAQTTRFELAEWKVRHERDGSSIVVGIEEGFSGARYIRHRFGQDCPGVELPGTLADTCASAVRLALANFSQGKGKVE